MANSTDMEPDDDFKAEFIFTWKIKKFIHCLPWTWVRSPTFVVESMDNTKWCLQLWPKEYTDGIHMEYYLARDESDSGPEFIRVAFELSFLDHCGNQLVKESREASFTRDTFKGFAKFVKQVEVYNERRNEYLPEDILTTCCRMRQIGGKPLKPVFCSATSGIGIEQISFDWSINNFSKIRPGMKKTIIKKSPSIKVQFSLNAKPNEGLQFEISHAHMDEPNLTDCEIGVLSAFKDTLYIKRDSRYLEGKVWRFPVFVKKSQLIAERNIYLRKDILTLKFSISISLGVTSSVINGYRSRSSSLEDLALSVIKERPPTVDDSISSAKKLIDNLNKDVQNLFNDEGKSKKEIVEEFSLENSSSRVNGRSSSINDGQNEKEIAREFSLESSSLLTNGCPFLVNCDDFSLLGNLSSSPSESEGSYSLVSEHSSPIQNEDSFSSECEKMDEFCKFDTKSNRTEEVITASNVKNELQRFYEDGTFSDISLTAGKETFPAHRLILSLKSRKFKDIFMSDLSKKNIELLDVDSGTLRDLLDFIYTNNVDNMTWDKVQNLFLAAENYQVTSLKDICFRFMKENINESNACSVLILGEEQQAEEVKRMALQFIVNHGMAIINTTAWDDLSKKNIKLAFEVMQQMYLSKT